MTKTVELVLFGEPIGLYALEEFDTSWIKENIIEQMRTLLDEEGNPPPPGDSSEHGLLYEALVEQARMVCLIEELLPLAQLGRQARALQKSMRALEEEGY